MMLVAVVHLHLALPVVAAAAVRMVLVAVVLHPCLALPALRV